MRNSLGLIDVVVFGSVLASFSNNTVQIKKFRVKGCAYEKDLHKGYLKSA